MERDINPFPNIKVLEVGRYILDHLPTMLPRTTLATHGDHQPHGAAEMLDAALDTPVQASFGWDSEGTYINDREY